MATLIETPTPEIQERSMVRKPMVAPPGLAALPVVPRIEYRALFSDSLLDSGSPEKKRRTWSTTLSFSFQCVLLGMLAIMPLLFTEALPEAQLLTILVAPPPPPPPPPPAAQVLTKIIHQTDVLNTGQLRTPTRIPQKIEMIKEEEAPPPVPAGGSAACPAASPADSLME